jgi:hypothetical protein
MSYIFDPATVSSDQTDRSKRATVPESQWRQYDFGMDCLIPAEDYALPKGYSRKDD